MGTIMGTPRTAQRCSTLSSIGATPEAGLGQHVASLAVHVAHAASRKLSGRGMKQQGGTGFQHADSRSRRGAQSKTASCSISRKQLQRSKALCRRCNLSQSESRIPLAQAFLSAHECTGNTVFCKGFQTNVTLYAASVQSQHAAASLAKSFRKSRNVDSEV